MDSLDKLDLLEAENSLNLYNEFKEAVKVFKYHVDTDLRTYLANEVSIETVKVGDAFYFKVTLVDAWVYEAARTQRFVPEVTLYEVSPVHVQRLQDEIN